MQACTSWAIDPKGLHRCQLRKVTALTCATKYAVGAKLASFTHSYNSQDDSACARGLKLRFSLHPGPQLGGPTSEVELARFFHRGAPQGCNVKACPKGARAKGGYCMDHFGGGLAPCSLSNFAFSGSGAIAPLEARLTHQVHTVPPYSPNSEPDTQKRPVY